MHNLAENIALIKTTFKGKSHFPEEGHLKYKHEHNSLRTCALSNIGSICCCIVKAIVVIFSVTVVVTFILAVLFSEEGTGFPCGVKKNTYVYVSHVVDSRLLPYDPRDSTVVTLKLGSNE